MEFSSWITQKYVEWRGDRLKNISIAEFASQFGASHQLVLDWMKKDGKKPRSSKYINALVRVYGLEVYDVLGLERPSEVDLEAALSAMPREIREPFAAAYGEYNAELDRAGINSDSPEAREIIRQAFERHGLEIKVIDGKD
jgi:hypothetical protein